MNFLHCLVWTDGRGRAVWLFALLAMLCAGAVGAQTITSEWASRPLPAVRAAAEGGDAAAMRVLANAYLAGESGLKPDAAEAARWLRRAAEQKDVLAQFVLGILHDEGRGVPRDMNAAVHWYRQAAEASLPDAQFNLGVCYAKGEGVARDQAEAIKWFTRAADQGDAQAQSRLGLAFVTGNGVERNPASASRYLRFAATQGDAVAQYFLARLYQEGEGLLKEPSTAATWFRKAAEQGHVEAQYQLGLAYASGDGIVRDPREAAAWFAKAAVQGHSAAQKQLGYDTAPLAVPPTKASASTPAPLAVQPGGATAPATSPKGEPPQFFSAPAGRELPPTATGRDEAATAAPGKIESPAFISAPTEKGTPAPTPPSAFPSGNSTKEEPATALASTPSATDQGMGYRPREAAPPESRRSTSDDLLVRPQPALELVSPTTLAVMTMAVAVAMLLVLGYMLVFFKARVTSLENEIKKTQFELSKANVNLTAMLHQVEALQLGEGGGGGRADRKQLGSSWKESAESKGDTAFRAKRRPA